MDTWASLSGATSEIELASIIARGKVPSGRAEETRFGSGSLLGRANCFIGATAKTICPWFTFDCFGDACDCGGSRGSTTRSNASNDRLNDFGHFHLVR